MKEGYKICPYCGHKIVATGDVIPCPYCGKEIATYADILEEISLEYKEDILLID